MSFMAAAAIGSAIVSGISSRRARNDAQGSYDQAQQTLGKQMGVIDEFEGLANKFASLGQGQFDKYQTMFGGLEEKLSDYYMNLSPDELAATGNQNAQQQYQQAMGQVNDQLAAQGIMGSGIQTQMGMQGATDMAQQKAQNIQQAPHEVAQMQQGWMNYGAGRQDQAWNQMSQGVGMQNQVANMRNNALGGMGGMQSGMGDMYMGQYQQGQKSMGAGLGSAAYFGSQRPMGADGKLGQSTFDKWGW